MRPVWNLLALALALMPAAQAAPGSSNGNGQAQGNGPCKAVDRIEDGPAASAPGFARCPEEPRPHDERVFTVNQAALPFAAMANSTVETDRWWGVLGGAGYRVEVPKNWNGMLVMYAHGYAGTGAALGVSNPSIRRHLIEQGYAWAASSYSSNYYDVRAGVEDTNALALAFERIAADNGRELRKPRKVYITGHSMGGHITGAAIDLEAERSANHRMRYDGAVPMCGVMGDTELFDYFVAYQLAAQALAGQPATSFPVSNWAQIAPSVRAALFTQFSTQPTAQGLKLREVVKNLTGGERPIFAQGFANSGLQNVVWGTFGGDGTINGILTENVTDTRRITYQLDNDPAMSLEEFALNNQIIDVEAEPGANRLRRDGLRWIPKVNGKFNIPVVSLHTLGDMYVPFHMQQVFRQRAQAQGSAQWLVQRAVRAPSHCDFTVAEQVAAFEAMARWEQTGVRPEGDDVLAREVVAQPNYGCRFTVNAGGPDDNPTTIAVRGSMPACTP
jgi:hypothetical protein